MIDIDGEEPKGVVDYEWKYACDDCLAGIHYRCRRRRHCACSLCAWPHRKPGMPPPSSGRVARPPKRPGVKSARQEYNSVNDEVCEQALVLLKRANFSEVASALGVERTNLLRAMKRRGMR